MSEWRKTLMSKRHSNFLRRVICFLQLFDNHLRHILIIFLVCWLENVIMVENGLLKESHGPTSWL